MPNLFPDNDYQESSISVSSESEYKGSYKFDFDKGDFAKNPDGSIARCNGLEAYKQWCQKVMNTPLRLLAYSKLFGHELNTLIGSEYSKGAVELEVKRMTMEALLVHPKTKDVTNFSFVWQNSGELYYTYTVISIDGDSFELDNTTKVR